MSSWCMITFDPRQKRQSNGRPGKAAIINSQQQQTHKRSRLYWYTMYHTAPPTHPTLFSLQFVTVRGDVARDQQHNCFNVTSTAWHGIVLACRQPAIICQRPASSLRHRSLDHWLFMALARTALLPLNSTRPHS